MNAVDANGEFPIPGWVIPVLLVATMVAVGVETGVRTGDPALGFAAFAQAGAGVVLGIGLGGVVSPVFQGVHWGFKVALALSTGGYGVYAAADNGYYATAALIGLTAIAGAYSIYEQRNSLTAGEAAGRLRSASTKDKSVLAKELCGSSVCDPNVIYEVDNSPLMTELKAEYESSIGRMGNGTVEVVPGREIRGYGGQTTWSYDTELIYHIKLNVAEVNLGDIDAFLTLVGHEFTHAAQAQTFGIAAWRLAYDKKVPYFNRPLEVGAERIGRLFAAKVTGRYVREYTPKYQLK